MMELIVDRRDVFGKKLGVLRKQDLIPAELYGRGTDNLHLSVPAKDFKKIFREAGENTIINLVIEEEKKPVFIYKVTHHPVSDEILNVDFLQVKMDEKVEATVPLEFVGEAPAVKEKEGALVKVIQELEVEALPADMPHSIEVDVSGLVDIGQSIHVEDLPLSQLVNGNVRILAEPGSVVATIKAQITKEEEKALEEQVIDVEGVKVEGEKKEEEVEKKSKETEEETQEK